MLSETFIAASLAPPRLTSSTSALLKDAGVYVHSYQPHPRLQATFKKSAAIPNCMAISSTRVFVAQAEKATIHVYDRRKGTQEAILSFRDRITSISLLADAFLAIGYSNGSIAIWEILTGRIVSTSQLHLQPVTALVSDQSNNFLLSASADSTILAWAVEDILSLSSATFSDHFTLKPRHTLTTHRLGITALAIGHGSSGCNLSVSSSKDRTAVLWEYMAGGDPLRVFLLPDAPLALQFDPADRAIFLSYSDASVQCIDIIGAHNDSRAPVKPPDSTIWRHPSASSAGPATTLSISHDGTMLLTGHASGKIYAWSISEHSLAMEIAEYPGAPITNLSFITPMPFTKLKISSCSSQATKPRLHDSFSGSAGKTLPNGSYSLQARLSSLELECIQNKLRVPRKRLCLRQGSSFSSALATTGFSYGIARKALENFSMTAGLTSLSESSGTSTSDTSDDFMALDGTLETASAASSRQNGPIMNVNETILAELFALQRERQDWILERTRLMQRRRRKEERRREAVNTNWHSKTGVRPVDISGSISDKHKEQDGATLSHWNEGSELSCSTDEEDKDFEADQKSIN